MVVIEPVESSAFDSEKFTTTVQLSFTGSFVNGCNETGDHEPNTCVMGLNLPLTPVDFTKMNNPSLCRPPLNISGGLDNENG